MPDKKRHRKGRIEPRPQRTIEDEIRQQYQATRRNTWWWGNDRGSWPGIWMRLATKYKMSIVQVKNIVGYHGITDRPLPAPLIPDEHRKRQYHKGEQMAEDVRRQWARDFQRALWDAEHGR
jgi:hypothetical protein